MQKLPKKQWTPNHDHETGLIIDTNARHFKPKTKQTSNVPALQPTSFNSNALQISNLIYLALPVLHPPKHGHNPIEKIQLEMN